MARRKMKICVPHKIAEEFVAMKTNIEFENGFEKAVEELSFLGSMLSKLVTAINEAGYRVEVVNGKVTNVIQYQHHDGKFKRVFINDISLIDAKRLAGLARILHREALKMDNRALYQASIRFLGVLGKLTEKP